MNPHLKALLASTLAGGLPRGLRDALDDALAKGADPAEILRRVRRAAGGRGPLTVAACEAYLNERMEGKS